MSEKFGYEFIPSNVHSREDPPPPPQIFDAYVKQGEAANVVMTMRDGIVADFNKEMREADVDEEDALART